MAACQGLFITGTGTDVGKTYVTALLIKKMRQTGLNAGYYKAALSGAESIADSDAGYVNHFAAIGQAEDTLVSYLYKQAVSPHLAAQSEGNPAELGRIKHDFARVAQTYDMVVVEGSGGIICPIRFDEEEKLFLEDIVRELDLDVLIVADAGLGTINSTVLTVSYLEQRNFRIRGILLNQYSGSDMQKDNRKMIESLTGIPVIACIEPNAADIGLTSEQLLALCTQGRNMQ